MSLSLWSFIIESVAFIIALVVAVYSWRQMRVLSVGVMGWFVAALVLSRRGFFADERGWSSGGGDLLGFFIFGTLMSIPLVIFFVGWVRSHSFADFLARLPLPGLIVFEVYRVAGSVFLWLYLDGRLPREMGIFTAFADVFIGLTALPLAWAVARGWPSARRLAIAWNIFGISDFVIAVSMVSLSIFGVVTLRPDPVMIGLHPLALIALFQLPLSIAIHAVALHRLFSQKGSESWQTSSSLVPPKVSV